jgi:hypothetical protein
MGKKIFAEGKVEEPRPGKKVGILRVHLQQQHEGKTYQFMRVMRAVERTIDKKGQMLIIPEVEVEAWWTTLHLPDEKVIALYKTMPQVNSSTAKSNQTWIWNVCLPANLQPML